VGDSRAVVLKGTSALTVDVAKVAAEAEDLARMSLGGVTVVGAYLVAPTAAAQAAAPQLRVLLTALRIPLRQLTLPAADAPLVLLQAASGASAVTAAIATRGASAALHALATRRL